MPIGEGWGSYSWGEIAAGASGPSASDVQGFAIAFDDDTLEPNPAWTNIQALTGCRVQSLSWRRGRPDEFSKTGTGTASVRILDLEGLFDPTNLSSDYFGKILPDKQAAISLYDPVLEEWHTQFRGYIENWNYTLGITREWFELQIDLVDGFAILNDAELQPGSAGDPPPSGSEGNVFYEDTAGSVSDRIDAILADIGWPSDLTEIFSGNVKVQETTYAPGTQALAALFDAADAEFPGVANLYMSKDGILTFHGRQARFRPNVAAYHIREQEVADPSVTVGDPTVCPVHELSFNLGKDFVFNSVLAYPQGIDEADVDGQLVQDLTSIGIHGLKSLSFTDLLTLTGLATGNTAEDETLLFAEYYKENYPEALPRISRMVFKSRMPDHRLAGPLWKMLTRVEISDLLTVTTAHPGGGGFAGAKYYVEGITCTVEPLNPIIPMVTLELDVSPAGVYDSNPFEADDVPS